MSNANPNLPANFRNLVINKAFASIDDIVVAMENAELFDRKKQSAMVEKWKKVEARRMIRQLKDATGWPIFFSLTVADEDGNERHFYGQEALFDLDQYQIAIKSFATASIRAAATANELTRRARKKLGLTGRQLPLPFPDAKKPKK